jgi:hypothetical protein
MITLSARNRYIRRVGRKADAEVKMNDTTLTLRAALAQDRLEEFVRQAQALGVTLDKGSDFERGLALLIVRRRKDQDGPSLSPSGG